MSRLARILGVQFEQLNGRCEIYTNLDWIVGDDTVVRPDLMVVCGDQPPRHLNRCTLELGPRGECRVDVECRRLFDAA